MERLAVDDRDVLIAVDENIRRVPPILATDRACCPDAGHVIPLNDPMTGHSTVYALVHANCLIKPLT